MKLKLQLLLDALCKHTERKRVSELSAAQPPRTCPVSAEHRVQHAHEGAGVGCHVGLAGLVPKLPSRHRSNHHRVRMPLGLQRTIGKTPRHSTKSESGVNFSVR